jgi:hypothetical protein
LRRPDQFRCVEPGIFGRLTRHNRATTLTAERSDFIGTERLWKELLAKCSDDHEASD